MKVLQSRNFNKGYFSDLAENLKFRYLGLGFLWAWIYATWMTPVVFPGSIGLTVNNDLSWLLSSAAVAVTLLVLPLLLKDRDVSTLKGVYFFAGPVTTLGSVMMASEPLFGISSSLIAVVGGLLTGVTSGLLWMLWGEFTGKVEQEVTETFVPWCVAVPLVAVFMCTFVSGPLAGLAICFLPAISSWLVYLSFKDKDVIKPVSLLPVEDRPKFMGDFVKVGVGSLAIYICISFAWGLMDYDSIVGWGDTHLLGYVFGAILAIVITTLAISYSTRLDIFGLYRWLIPVMLFGLVFLSIDSFLTQSLALVLITVAQYGFDIIIWIYFSRIVRKGVCSGSFALGINRGFVQMGVFSGSLLAMFVPRLLMVQGFSIQLAVLLLSAAMVTVVLMVLDRKNEFDRLTPKDPSAIPEAEPGIVDYEAVCSKLAEERGLTAREREILGYLARGRSLPYIRDVLILSKNTVDTHAKNLYRKLGVHSRQDLIDLIETESKI